jgi:hypothetical protein
MQNQSCCSTFTMHGSLPPNRVAERPRPIGVREGRRASLIYLPRHCGLDVESKGKASEQSLLTRSLVDPAGASRKPRPKVVAAPPVASFPPSRGPPSPRGQVGGDQDCHTEKASAPAAALKSFPCHFPGLNGVGTRVPVWKICQRPYRPPTDRAPLFRVRASALTRARTI